MLTYIKTSHRLRGTIHEEVLCAKHLAELPAIERTPHGLDKGGYRLEVRAWTGEPVDCTQCDVSASFGGKVAATVALLLCLLLPSLASAQGAVGALVLGNVLDSVSTEIALQRPSLSEGNPVLGQSRPQRLIVKSASTALQVWIVRQLDRSGHPRLAKVVGYSAGAALSGVAVWNWRQGR